MDRLSKIFGHILMARKYHLKGFQMIVSKLDCDGFNLKFQSYFLKNNERKSLVLPLVFVKSECFLEVVLKTLQCFGAYSHMSLDTQGIIHWIFPKLWTLKKKKNLCTWVIQGDTDSLVMRICAHFFFISYKVVYLWSKWRVRLCLWFWKSCFLEMAKLLLILCFYYLKYIFDNCLKSINNEMMKYMTWCELWSVFF